MIRRALLVPVGQEQHDFEHAREDPPVNRTSRMCANRSIRNRRTSAA